MGKFVRLCGKPEMKIMMMALLLSFRTAEETARETKLFWRRDKDEIKIYLMLQKHNKNGFGPTNGNNDEIPGKWIDGRAYTSRRKEESSRFMAARPTAPKETMAIRKWERKLQLARSNSALKWDRAKPKQKKLFFSVCLSTKSKAIFELWLNRARWFPSYLIGKYGTSLASKAPRGAFQFFSERRISRRNDQNQHCVLLRNLFIYQARENEFSGTT